MKLGLVKPNYPGEKRVALLPQDLKSKKLDNEILVEKDFGSYLNIPDEAYEEAGCKVLERQDIFGESDAVFSLKLIQEADYGYLKDRQMIIGWTHPTGSGEKFMKTVAGPKSLVVADLDNIYPKLHFNGRSADIDWLPRNFIYKNSINAGYSATLHAITQFGLIPGSDTQVAVLSAGNVSQGAFGVISKLGASIRLFYRKTMTEFYDTIGEYDIIINGIEVDDPNAHIISKEQLLKCKPGCFIIDAAADAGNAIETTRYTSIADPIYEENGLFFYEVNNAPSIFYRSTSVDISESFSKYIYAPDIGQYFDLARKIGY